MNDTPKSGASMTNLTSKTKAAMKAQTNGCRGVTLRPVRVDDMPMLFPLMTNPAMAHCWGMRRVLSEAEFYDSWRSPPPGYPQAKFIVQRNGRAVGLAFDYDHSPDDLYTKVAVLLSPGEGGRGAGVIAATLFAGWLFRTRPLRKVYLEVYGFNVAVVAMLEKAGVRRDATLPEHRYWDGQLWDFHCFSVSRQDVDQIQRRLLPGPHAPGGNGRLGQASVFADGPSALPPAAAGWEFPGAMA